MILPEIAIGAGHVEAFLDLFSSTPASLAHELRNYPKPWQMLPIQDRPLLRLGDDVVVLDERYLVERVTRGLYWLVHDYEKAAYGEIARNKWTQSYSEMVETRVEDQLRRMAPSLIGGAARLLHRGGPAGRLSRRRRTSTPGSTSAATSSWPRSSRAPSRSPPASRPT